MNERVLTDVQIFAVVVTLVSGVLTVFAERKKDRGLSLKGKVGMASAIVAGIIAFWVVLLQARIDRKKAEDQANASQAQAKTNESLLRNIQRQLYPIMPQQPITISSEWEIKLSGPDMKVYSDRIHALLDPVIKGEVSAEEWCKQHEHRPGMASKCEQNFSYVRGTDKGPNERGPLATVYFDKRSELFPAQKEESLRSVLDEMSIRVCASKKKQRSVCNNADIEVRSIGGKMGMFSLDFDSGSPSLIIERRDVATDGEALSTGSIVSVADLSSSYLEVQTDGTESMNESAIRILNAMRPQLVELGIQGRRYSIGYPLSPYPDPPFTCQVQDGMETAFVNVKCPLI